MEMITYVTAIVLVAIGTYAIVVKENLIKKVIGLGLFT
ncbi:MAG: NADH-quinone oxidoreductase subunit K, partial [Candidatus Aenigmarchaeota archaeon]|nr:NADH-quinone oxidoreductase subunit K [Candidatus Aenigmarchaeota archaeon]MCK5372913.1 NADH-quinone oxidoreductase subunit K [Candidatus Aenigmarchaeota archaeon]